MNRLKQFSWVAVLFAVAFPIFAQNPSSFGGIVAAWDFAYGINSQTAALRVDIGNSATGAGTVVLAYGFLATSDGRKVMPLATNAPITIGIGANLETVTPSAVSCATPAVYDTCSVTATFANIHGTGDLVASGTNGIAEAVNYSHSRSSLTGVGSPVAVDINIQNKYATHAALNTAIIAVLGWAGSPILDWTGWTTTPFAQSYRSTGTSSASAYTASGVILY